MLNKKKRNVSGIVFNFRNFEYTSFVISCSLGHFLSVTV